MGVCSIKDGLLYIKGVLVPQISCPVKKYSEGVNTQDYIIMHYTAGLTMQSATQEYQDPTTQLSWHLQIDRSGNIFQLLPFDKVAWHAGESSWGTGPNRVVGLNAYSIGIEMSNAGPLQQKGAGYATWSGQLIPGSDVFFDANGGAWHAYSPAQLATAEALVGELAVLLDVQDVLGHADIAPGRKRDPGEAFAATLKKIRTTYANLPRPLG